MFLIETTTQLQQIAESKQKIKLIVPIRSSNNKHQYTDTTSFIYCKTEEESFVINVNHIDAGSCNPTKVEVKELIHSDTLVYGSRYCGIGGIDYEMVYFDEHGESFRLQDHIEGLYKNYNRLQENINDCIPILKWIEKLDQLPIPQIKHWHKDYTNNIRALGRIEKVGIKIDPTKMILSGSNGDMAYTRYNPYTITGRPSNTFGGINWVALNKSDGSRSGVISRWDGGKLVSLDFESYHLRLIAKVVGYKFPNGISAHQHLAEFYGCDYESAKSRTFRYLYGGLDDLTKGIPFFQSCSEWIDKLWQDFIISGKIVTPIFKREISHERVENPNPQKVFNYQLQALETEVNYKKLQTIVEALEDYKSKLILYSYDAILIDTHPDETDEVTKLVKEIMEMGGFPTRAYMGDNYDNLGFIG